MLGRLNTRLRDWLKTRTWFRGPNPFPPGAEISCEISVGTSPPSSSPAALRSKGRRARPPAIPGDAIEKLDSALVVLEPPELPPSRRAKSAR
jgi:hypothetical protein